MQVTGKDGLSLKVIQASDGWKLTISRDGAARVETWKTAQALETRLSMLGASNSISAS